ncbi:MAG: tetratricopeptide repeat protein [Desulfobaccales bacterium]
MVRWLSMIILAACLALGGMTTGWASNLQEQAKEDTNKAAKAYLQEGLLDAGEGHDAEAAVAFRKAIAIRPDWAEAHSLLGSSLSRAGDLREAEAELRKAVQLKPDYAEGWNYLGEFLQARGKDQEAQDAFAKAKQYARPPH